MRKKEERKANEIVCSPLPTLDHTELVCDADTLPAAMCLPSDPACEVDGLLLGHLVPSAYTLEMPRAFTCL